MKQILLVIIFLFYSYCIAAQHLQLLPSGITYKIIKKGTSTRKARIGDYVYCTMRATISGTEIMNSTAVNNNEPGPAKFKIVAPLFNGDVMEGFAHLSEGDSAIFLVPQDSFYRNVKIPKESFVRAGDPVVYTIKVFLFHTESEFLKAAETTKNTNAIIANILENRAVQEKFLKNYLNVNDNTIYSRTSSGIYYVIENQGQGDYPKRNQIVTINYTGKNVRDEIFDTNMDTIKGNNTPISFELSKSKIFMEEGISLLKKGGSIKLYVPSNMVTYAKDKMIDALPKIFEVALLDIANPINTLSQLQKEEESIKAFCKKNNINNVQKTSSGLYYSIVKSGQGNNALMNQNVIINYTGAVLNGNTFDSNTDTAFGHVTPFSITLEQDEKVIKGFLEGLLLLKKGMQLKLFIPSKLGYGIQGVGDKIPANATLQFDIEALDIITNKTAAAIAIDDEAQILNYVTSHQIKNVQKTKSGLYYVITKQGKGNKPKLGEGVTLNYTASLLNDKVYDSNTDAAFGTPSPNAFTLEYNGKVINGIIEGLLNINRGATVKFLIPSALAYGTKGSSQVPANSPVIFDIQLIDFNENSTPEVQTNAEAGAILKYFNNNDITNFQKTKSGLFYVIDKPGAGPLAKNGDDVIVNYTGYILQSGKAFDSNTDIAFKHVKPIKYTVGNGAVIDAWEEALLLLNKGAKVRLFTPSTMAYKQAGAGDMIPPNTTLYYDIELKNIVPKLDAAALTDTAIQAYFKKYKITTAQKMAGGYYYQSMLNGQGDAPLNADVVNINYTAYLLNGTKFDSNTDPAFGHAKEFNFQLGNGYLFKSIEEAILNMKTGGKAVIYLPSNLAYGDSPPSTIIPINSPVIFEIELVEITKGFKK
jgi:FKBP-type peptidyl-prolyl cis-trans isomerase FkpA